MMVDNNLIMQEVMTMPTYDGTRRDRSWSQHAGGEEAAKSKGDAMLKGLMESDCSIHHCNSTILPSARGNIPVTVACA
ncbi:hypothetical protein MLD38_003218 [Melastoma candidum]|uniref:Uncharacterized protein n=1 Tax=Melastoma candidum TaxID=119954 RepID=A0ACB9S2I6_9MYRT|nr:hypothetical protein MLD38_003218 [Melastoma candidum]